MTAAFDNVYEDEQRAAAYAALEFPGTYALAFRDLPLIFSQYARGTNALDFGCGAGRSTRFLKNLGFDAIGIDVSDNMLKKAREFDQSGDYRFNRDDSTCRIEGKRFDVILSAFTFDNVPTMAKKISLFSDLKNLLCDEGILVNVVSSPDIYIHEWASFSTIEFPENKKAMSGDRVRIIMKDVVDKRPVEDIFWTDASYRDVYDASGLEIIETHRPLARDDEPFDWINETRVNPWVIYVLRRMR